jgi:phenylacetate-CoA ligase
MNHFPEIEKQTKENIKTFQENKLKELLRYLVERSPFYQRHFTLHRISISEIITLDDLRKVPPVTKDDLQKNNWDFLCVSRDQIAEYTSTSGTLGKPVTIALTKSDIDRLAYNECISFACADGTSDDVYQLMLTLDRQFMAGMAYYEGIKKLGAGLVRVGPGLPALQWETIERLQPTTLVAVPSFILKLVEYANQKGIDLNKSSVKKAVCIGESLRTPDFQLTTIGNRIQQAWNIQLFNTYASTEMQTAFTECVHGKGGHHHPELLIVELLDENNEPVSSGETGEVTITTLGVEGMPLLRYKTGDMVQCYDEPCACGRTTLRVGPVVGRKQQMIKLKGTTLYPPAIFEILNQVELISDYVVEAFANDLGLDELKVHMVATDKESAGVLLRNIFQSRVRTVPELNFCSSREIEALQGIGQSRKVQRFIDRRLAK